MLDVLEKAADGLLECSVHDCHRSVTAIEVPQGFSLPFEFSAVGIMTNDRADVLLCLPND